MKSISACITVPVCFLNTFVRKHQILFIGHGKCLYGVCFCDDGFYGIDCSQPLCPGSYCVFDQWKQELICSHCCTGTFNFHTLSFYAISKVHADLLFRRRHLEAMYFVLGRLSKGLSGPRCIFSSLLRFCKC